MEKKQVSDNDECRAKTRNFAYYEKDAVIFSNHIAKITFKNIKFNVILCAWTEILTKHCSIGRKKNTGSLFFCGGRVKPEKPMPSGNWERPFLPLSK
jgi:hypothetical protein